MLHIEEHLRNPTPTDSVRPDFFLVDHLFDINVINQEEYEHMREYSERPLLEGVSPLGSTIPQVDKQEHPWIEHNLAKERREMRRERTRKVMEPRNT